MVAMGHSVTLESEASRGRTVWALLCRAALRSIDWAASAWGVKEAQGQAERAELFVGYGGITPREPWGHQAVDWARRDEFDRGRIARETLQTDPRRVSTAFDDPRAAADAPRRRSIELHTLVFFD